MNRSDKDTASRILTNPQARLFHADRDPFKEVDGVRLVAVPPEAWKLLSFPEYQRIPGKARVKRIAEGIRGGYVPAPITLYRRDGKYLIVDGGHRFMAHGLNRELGHVQDILALLYDEETIDERTTFTHENTKLKMDPTAIIRADDRRPSCAAIKALGNADGPFAGAEDLVDYPIRPMSILKAALTLHAHGRELYLHNLAYLGVDKSLDKMDEILKSKGAKGRPAGVEYWDAALIPFLRSVVDLWGVKGRHLTSAGVHGFSYFCAKNRACFFDEEGKFAIKTTRGNVVTTRRQKKTYERPDGSDFLKLQNIKPQWEKWSGPLWIAAGQTAFAVAWEINRLFWTGRPEEQRIWHLENEPKGVKI